MKQKDLTPILIVLFIVSVLVGYLIYSGKINTNQKQVAQTYKSDVSPEPIGDAETTNWKTDTNTKYGYSIKYPDFLTQSFSSYNSPNGGKVEVDHFVGKENMSISINIYEDDANPEIRALLDSVGTQDIMINNQQVRKTFTHQGYQITVGPFRDENINYIFVYLARSSDSDSSIFDKMLSTFKFNP